MPVIANLSRFKIVFYCNLNFADIAFFIHQLLTWSVVLCDMVKLQPFLFLQHIDLGAFYFSCLEYKKKNSQPPCSSFDDAIFRFCYYNGNNIYIWWWSYNYRSVLSFKFLMVVKFHNLLQILLPILERKLKAMEVVQTCYYELGTGISF